MGPPGVEIPGAAAYANVPTRPSNRSNARKERFIGSFTLSLGSCRQPTEKAVDICALDYTQWLQLCD
jgi:hypothetical protein